MLFDIDEAQDLQFCEYDSASWDSWRPTFKARPGSRVHCTPTNYVQELVGDGNSIRGIFVSAVFVNFVKTPVRDAPTYIDENGKIYVRLPWDPKEIVGDGDYVVFMLDANESCQHYHVKTPAVNATKWSSRGDSRKRR